MCLTASFSPDVITFFFIFFSVFIIFLIGKSCGVYRYKSSQMTFEGDFDASGRRCGEGRLSDQNGVIFEGLWKKNQVFNLIF
jgi:hypothetical protein